MNTGTALNWARITRYAVLMFLAHFSIGLLEGIFVAGTSDRETAFRELATSLAVTSLADIALFTRLAYRQRERRVQHAALVFLLMLGIARAFSALISLSLPSEHSPPLLLLGLSASVLSMLSGTWLGYAASLRRATEG